MLTRSHKLKVQDVCAVDSEKICEKDVCAVDSEKICENGYVEFPMAWLANDHLLRSAVVHVVIHKGNAHLD